MSVQLNNLLSGVHSRVRDAGFRSQSDFGGGHSNLPGTIIGGVVGAGVGAAAGYEISSHEIHNLPIQSVSETWQAPVTQNTTIGKVPQDYYSPGSFGYGWDTNVAQRDVNSRDYGGTVVTNGSGQAAMQTETHTWTAHGTPIVNWKDTPIQSPVLDKNAPFSESTQASTHQDCNNSYDGNGNSQSNCYTVTDGYWHYFSPNVDYKSVANASGATTYQRPDVKFDTGVNTGLNIALGAVGGAVVGAAAGYLISKSINH